MPHTKLGTAKDFKGKSKFGLYGDCIEEIDWSVGEIRKKLEKLGLEKNTVILYASDNGPWRARGTHGGSCFPLRGGKATTWEGGVRVPCIMWGEELKSGIVNNQLSSTMDILPTFINMAGIEKPKNLVIDGQDISLSILKGKKQTFVKEVYYYYYYTHLQAVRSGDWKLVLPRPQAPFWLPNNMMNQYRREDMEPVRDFELYNLRTDISERRNLSKNNPDKVKELLALVEEAKKDIGDYKLIGEGARFFDEGVKRPDALKWQKDHSSLKGEYIKIHPYYDDGGRIMRNSNHFKK